MEPEVSVAEIARVVLALEAPDMAEEVLDFLDRSGRARVVATAADDRQLDAAVRQLEPDAVVAGPSLAPHGVAGAPLLVLATRESVGALRAAIGAGAAGFFVWPGEREVLADGVAATVAARRAPERHAVVIAVHAARGGAGCTFVATNLAQAVARRGATCTLIDADPTYGDLTHALGATGEDVRTMADLVPVADELTSAHLGEVLWRDASGFGALLAPPVDALSSVDGALVGRAVEVAASVDDVVVLGVPRALDEGTRRLLSQADRVLEVLTLDVLSFRAASRALEVLSPLDLDVGFVVNRAARSEITPGDVRRVFGAEPLAVLPADGAVPRLQDHGRLVAPRGRLGRAFGRLAARMLDPPAGGEVPVQEAS